MPCVWSPGRLNFYCGQEYFRALSMKLESYKPSGDYNFHVALIILENLCNPVTKG